MEQLPDDIALKIVSFVQVTDVCALGSCSRFWRDLCRSDYLWAALSRERWPSLDLSEQTSVSKRAKVKENDSSKEDIDNRFSPAEGWRSFYIKCHKEMAGKATFVAKFVEQHSRTKSLEVRDYLGSMEQLYTMGLGFKDIVMFLFASKQSTLLNLVGIHYSIYWLRIPADIVLEALQSCQISQRQVSVRWWTLGRLLFGFRMPDKVHSCRSSLADLASGKENEVLGILHRGRFNEVLRVLVSVADEPCNLERASTSQGVT